MTGPMAWSKQFYLAPRRGLNPLLCRGVASAAVVYTHELAEEKERWFLHQNDHHPFLNPEHCRGSEPK